VCATEVESNLLAMGFELTSDGAVARLPDELLTVQQPGVKAHAAQVPAKSDHTTAVRPAANKSIVTPAANGKTGSVDAGVSTAATADGPQQQSLYNIIRQRSQMSTQNEQSTASSADVNDVVRTLNSDVDNALNVPSVKFCLEKNAFISASSAEESQCR